MSTMQTTAKSGSGMACPSRHKPAPTAAMSADAMMLGTGDAVDHREADGEARERDDEALGPAWREDSFGHIGVPPAVIYEANAAVVQYG